jgi:hypothetical protein
LSRAVASPDESVCVAKSGPIYRAIVLTTVLTNGA